MIYPYLSHLCNYPKNTKILIQKDICTPTFTVALITIIKIWKQPKCTLVDERVNKMFVSWIHTLILLPSFSHSGLQWFYWILAASSMELCLVTFVKWMHNRINPVLPNLILGFILQIKIMDQARARSSLGLKV